MNKTSQISNYLNNLKLENTFFLLAFIFGMITIFVTPPFQVPDEFMHFCRAYELSEMKIVAQNNEISVGDYLPVSIQTTANNIFQEGIHGHAEKKQKIDDVVSVIKIPLNPNEKTFIFFHNTAVYSPVPYLLQSLFIFILRIFNFTPIIMFYCLRIVNFLTWMIITYFALKILPFGKILLLVIALLPMTMFQAASTNADAVTNSLAFLTIALFLNYSLIKDKLHNFNIISLMVITILLSLCKPIYFPICFLFFLIPIEKIGAKKRYFLLAILIICLNIVSIGAWAYISRTVTLVPLIQTVNPKIQMQFILLHPFSFIITLINTYFKEYWYLLKECIGVLGWLDTALPGRMYEIYAITLLIVALLDGNKLDIRNRILLILIFLVGLSITGITLYTVWTPIGNNCIYGLQGRYFIPFLPLLFLAIGKTKIKYLSFGIVPLLIVLYSISLITLFSRYYIT